MGGGDVAPELVEVIREAWRDVIGNKAFPLRFSTPTCTVVAKYLTDLGIENFELVWRRNIMKIRMDKIQSMLKFFGLVAGFWRIGLDDESANKIEDLMHKMIMTRVQKFGYFINTVNHLLIEFAKP